MKKNLLILQLFILSSSLFCQEKSPYKIGSISQADYELTVYEKDSTANAVFIYEHGKTTFHETDRRIVIRTKYYAKVKIFNKEGVKNATVRVPFYNNKQASEKVTKIRAITHNGLKKTGLHQNNIFTEKISEHWSEVKFTMPNIKDNSIIEYEYTLESPFKFTFKGWEFQDDIPKIYSEFYALIPGNYVYNRRLVGYQDLLKNISEIKKRCFSVSGVPGAADCEELTYAMKEVPAFIKEDYMTSRENYIASIKFELSEFHGFDGSKNKYTKSWKSIDKEFRADKDIGRQLKKVDYIKKKLPTHLIEGENNLAKAKKIYSYIQNYFTWNNKMRIFTEVRVKEAFENKVGNSSEINISLINALNAAGFDTEIMLMSTRNNGLPTKAHPIMSDFNYAIAKLNIGTESYLLDATNKEMPFGMLPFRILNGYGRVMNFKKGSYWHTINPKKNNLTNTTLNLKLNAKGNFQGAMHQSYNGYKAINKRKEIINLEEDDYLTKIEDAYVGDADLVVNSYNNTNLDSIDKPLKELFDITIDSELNGKYLLISPFIADKTSSNPFKLKERTYPVDFGYPSTYQYILKLEIPEAYKVKELPKKAGFSLPNNGGTYIFNIEQKNNEVTLISRITLKRSFYLPQEYPYLKEFYNQIIKTQKSLITLEKIN